MTKKIIWICIVFLLISFVSAQPPFQEAGGDVALDIRAPTGTFLKQGQDVQLNTHLYNRSNGLLINNTEASCTIHVYNITGHHIIEEALIPSGVFDFQLNISGGNFSLLGEYSFVEQCNTSTIGGFVSRGIEVTKSGFEERRFMIPILIGIITIMLFFGAIGYSAKSLNIKSFGYGIALIQLVNIAFILYVSESGESLITILRINFWAISILAFGIGMIGLIKWTIRLINPANNEEDEKKKWEK